LLVGHVNLPWGGLRRRWEEGIAPPDSAEIPDIISGSGTPFSFNRAAPAPREWLTFLRQLWPDDPKAIDTLQEWFGYLLTLDTRQQKILFLLGPPRSGKGTISRVLRELVGPSNVVGPTLGSLAGSFGLSPLLGKSVAIVSDARLSGRSDSAVIVERLLSISGEDAISVDRKFRDSLTVKLPTRFVVISNELPRMGDASGALAGRMILLRLTRTWVGQEDHHMFDRLKSELPGILLWAVEGWRRLRERGWFVQPPSAAELVEEMEDLSSPVGAFVRERCRVGPGERVEVAKLFEAWRSWCDQDGRCESGTKELFGSNLRAAVPSLNRARPRTQHGLERLNMYVGIGLLEPSGHSPSGPSGQGGHGDRTLHALRNGELSATRGTVCGHRDHLDQPPASNPDRN
jgi:putative DNA primase/helicase